MTLIFCLDDNNGLMFNGRRQSSDRTVTERIMRYADGRRVLIEAYSAKLLPGAEIIAGQFCVNDIVFAETGKLIVLCIDKADKLIIYKWNRVYPADVHVSIEQIAENWRLQSKLDFSGNSHDLITEEVYVRE